MKRTKAQARQDLAAIVDEIMLDYPASRKMSANAFARLFAGEIIRRDQELQKTRALSKERVDKRPHTSH